MVLSQRGPVPVLKTLRPHERCWPSRGPMSTLLSSPPKCGSNWKVKREPEVKVEINFISEQSSTAERILDL